MKIIDISQPFSNTLAHWPGDIAFRYETVHTKDETGSVNIGKIETSLHSGTHVDAPFHVDNDGLTIDQLPLDPFLGDAVVIDVSNEDIIQANAFESINASRVLLKTNTPNNPEHFPSSIATLSIEAIHTLSKQGVKLIGVDVPSVDALNSKNMAIHHEIHRHGMFILENVMLDGVTPGNYFLSALPLHLNGADGSPVRAVLMHHD
ncbi:kynurenine formamidase [Bacillaceae bacterium JMAK1]|nr:kynurenine formamidase [Bacillaceae bacterium JMAK1]